MPRPPDRNNPCDSNPLRTQTESPTVTMRDGARQVGSVFTPGQLLGERYRIRSLLGAGGMGEVWHAFDLRLRVDVALKAGHHVGLDRGYLLMEGQRIG